MRNIMKGAALAFVVALTLSAEPPSICGKDDRYPTANIDLIQVSCLDFTALRVAAPEIPWPAKPQTQVLVHVREGDAVQVTLRKDGDGSILFISEYAQITTDAWGRRVALVVFDGIGYASVSVKVYRALE